MTGALIRQAARIARSASKSFPHGRVRLTPASHQALAEHVCEGTDIDPLAVVVASLEGLAVEIDADVPDPGWIVETWR